MGLLSKLNPFDSVFSFLDTAVDKIWPDADAESRRNFDKFAAELKAMVTLAVGQLELNKQEAKHSSVFVAGWRPFLGWVCGVGIGYQFVLYPLMCWGFYTLQAFDVIPMYVMQGSKPVLVTPPPPLNVEAIFTLVLGMLGLGGQRVIEKVKGVARSSVKGAQ